MEKRDFESILENYNLGKIKSFSKVKRPHYDRPCFIITTTKGKYFIKWYIRGMSEGFLESFKLLEYIQRKNIPTLSSYLQRGISLFYCMGENPL
ncbi:MAG: hypothetical protein KKE23_01565 [Nanoarchaeota archaeon]|nr:hypothetical protein [Nanoarchaeota archaeon]